MLQTADRVTAAVDALDLGSRALLDLWLRQGVDDNRIAALLRLPPAEVGRRRARALERLGGVVDGDGSPDLEAVRAALCRLSATRPGRISGTASRRPARAPSRGAGDPGAARPRNGHPGAARRANGASGRRLVRIRPGPDAPVLASTPTVPVAAGDGVAPPAPLGELRWPAGRRVRRPPTARVAVAILIVLMAGAVVVAVDRLGGADERAAPSAARPLLEPAGRAAPSRAARKAPANVYAGATSTSVPAALRDVPERVYVPNNAAGTVDVIDPKRFKVIRSFGVGQVPHHITPDWAMERLYVNNTASNSLTVIDPRKGRPVRKISVTDPYNLYFTPDGRRAIVVAERFERLDFRDARTWKLIKSVPIPWSGVNHLDFSRDGRYLLASTEFSGMVVKVDTARMKITGQLRVGGLPVDVKLSPDGRVFYVANQDARGGVSVIDAGRMRQLAFLRTGSGAHGLSLSRSARSLFVSNRLDGSISVIDLRRRRVRSKWRIGGSPDMLQISPNGRQLWVSNRFSSDLSVVDTRTGRLIRKIPVGAAPHGLAYFPQPGRFSVGHNGVYR